MTGLFWLVCSPETNRRKCCTEFRKDTGIILTLTNSGMTTKSWNLRNEGEIEMLWIPTTSRFRCKWRFFQRTYQSHESPCRIPGGHNNQSITNFLAYIWEEPLTLLICKLPEPQQRCTPPSTSTMFGLSSLKRFFPSSQLLCSRLGVIHGLVLLGRSYPVSSAHPSRCGFVGGPSYRSTTRLANGLEGKWRLGWCSLRSDEENLRQTN